MKISILLILFMVTTTSHAQKYTVSSPDKAIALTIQLATGGEISYSVNYKNKKVVHPSSLGVTLKEPAVSLKKFSLVRIDSVEYQQTWEPVYGEYKSILDHHKEIKLTLQTKSKNPIITTLVFRVFNEGVGFRYEFPIQQHLNHFIVAGENSTFKLGADHMAFWIPGDYDSNEFTYSHTRLSAVDARISKTFESIFAKTYFNQHAVQTPLMMKSRSGLYINIHEAAQLNYPVMNLVIDKKDFTLTSHLVPDAIGNKAYLQTPAKTPWRTVIVTDDAREILPANRMILNLNEPSRLENTSFIKPQKFVGVWWEMHVGISSWDKASGKHGATTENVKRFIDFAAKHGIDGVLVEGWNEGWEDWFGKWKEDVFDFITPYPDYNMDELREYAKSKGVKIIMHHETSASVTNYERQLDTAFRYMKKNGMNTVKTGYVGYIIPRGEHHDGQWMTKHFERVAKKAAEYEIMIDAHEPMRPTGLHRTYPNWMTSEAARGNEFNAWSEGNPPAHETILPFTRLMGGPMDYTPGIFETKMNIYDSSKKNMVHTTLAKQLALYVTMYSPLQMVADLPENYERYPDAFQFIKDVAVDWDDTKVLAAEPGDYLAIARKKKNSSQWFVGGITDERARTIPVSFSFLEAGKTYTATIYRDGPNAHWEKNPKAYVIEKKEVTNKSQIQMILAPGGGTAISITPKN